MSLFQPSEKRSEVTEHWRAGVKVLEVDTSKASYHGLPWATLGAFGKRKYENLLVIENAGQTVKILYV